MIKDYAVKILKRILIINNRVIVSFTSPEQIKIMKIIKRIRSEDELNISDNEAYQLAMSVLKSSKIDGETAEVGVFKGTSAKIIGVFKKKSKKLFVFDTFEGLPEVGSIDVRYKKGLYKGDYEVVKNYLSKIDKVYVHKGLFPQETGNIISDKRFSFVNLDVDLYKSTLDCLKFFYPRMNKGGIILSHDYPIVEGVKKAFDEFFENKPEPIIELSGNQCLIVKTGDQYETKMRHVQERT